MLTTTVDAVPLGKALVVAMGQGRNALALARKGWEVTGFDLADYGMDTQKLIYLVLSKK